ncbi:MAG: hypothetical protein JXR39_09590 [Marinilabiliaceae bacterium]|nr:hypothetical protein [Marinilabiliaceae bacterium]
MKELLQISFYANTTAEQNGKKQHKRGCQTLGTITNGDVFTFLLTISPTIV